MLKNCIKNWKKIDDDMAADMAQRERSKIKYYVSAFSNILIDYIVKLDRENKILFGRFKHDPVLLQRNDVVFYFLTPQRRRFHGLFEREV